MLIKTIAVDLDETLHDTGTGEPVSEYAATVIKKWMDAGINVYILTARQSSEEESVRAWLAHNGFPTLPIVFTNGDTVAKMNFEWDILVDDSPTAVDAYLEKAPKGTLIHFHGRIGWVSQEDWLAGKRGDENRKPLDYEPIAFSWQEVEVIVGI